jgi:hypothetical protein
LHIGESKKGVTHSQTKSTIQDTHVSWQTALTINGCNRLTLFGCDHAIHRSLRNFTCKMSHGRPIRNHINNKGNKSMLRCTFSEVSHYRHSISFPVQTYSAPWHTSTWPRNYSAIFEELLKIHVTQSLSQFMENLKRLVIYWDRVKTVRNLTSKTKLRKSGHFSKLGHCPIKSLRFLRVSILRASQR